MHIHHNKESWVIMDFLDDNFIVEIKSIIQQNLNNLLCNKEEVSTRGKNAEQYWLRDSINNLHVNDLRYDVFEKKYKEQILKRINEAELFKQNDDKKCLSPICAWTVIGEENSYHTIHDHGGFFNGISTVLYLEVPDTNVEDESENNIFIITNVGQKNPLYQESIPPYLTINPEVGKLLIFPCWLPHGTHPQTKGIRQTFNVDFKIDIACDIINQKKFSYK